MILENHLKDEFQPSVAMATVPNVKDRLDMHSVGAQALGSADWVKFLSPRYLRDFGLEPHSLQTKAFPAPKATNFL